MIGFFTDPYPDELLYSACARYHGKTRNCIAERTVRDLFGKPRAHVAVDFPTRLGYLAAQLPAETYSANQLVEENTLLPLYSPFMPPDRLMKIQDGMWGTGGLWVHAGLGVLTTRNTVEYLRLCTSCVNDDRERYREPYWHRAHQIPGIEVCPRHAIFLLDSKVPTRHRSKQQYFVTAKQAVKELSTMSITTRQLDLRNRDHTQLIKLAKDALWILMARVEMSGQEVLRQRHLRLLFERGLATYGGRVRQDQLQIEFQNCFSSELLESLRCTLDGRHHWLRYILTSWKRAHNPLGHLLLIQFLECSAEEFFQMQRQVAPRIEPYGKGPWPCLNKAHAHYLENRITVCQITYTRDYPRCPQGTFRCECGFSYRRNGYDRKSDRRLSYDRVMSFGTFWYDKLQEMIAAGNHSKREMASALGVPSSTIATEIVRIEKARNAKVEIIARFARIRSAASASDEVSVRDCHRQRWSEVALENPGLSRSALGEKAHITYVWLLKHDQQWMDDNHPRRSAIGAKNRSGKTDWLARDLQYSTAVREMALRIKSMEGRPVRATCRSIALKLRILGVAYKSPEKLPLTRKALDEASDSDSEYAIRRLRWSANCFEREHVPASESQLLFRVCVRYQIASQPEVSAVIDECVRRLAEMNEQGWPSRQT